MHSQLNHVVAKQRSAELRRSGERARFASAANAQRPNLRNRNLISRASARLVDRMPPLKRTPRPAARNPAEACPAGDRLRP